MIKLKTGYYFIVILISDLLKFIKSLFSKKKGRVEIQEIIRECPGKLHSWVRSSAGVIRKENKNIPEALWKK